jgi:hypothetical protein
MEIQDRRDLRKTLDLARSRGHTWRSGRVTGKSRMEDIVDDSWKIQADLGRTQGKSGGGKTDFQYCTSFIPKHF